MPSFNHLDEVEKKAIASFVLEMKVGADKRIQKNYCKS
jgi:hypothetical protein